MGLGRGVMFGAIWGMLASALLLVVLSLAAPVPQGQVAEVQPAAPARAAPEVSADLAPTLAPPQAAENGPAMPEPMPEAPDLPPGLAAAPQAPGGVGDAPAQAAPVDPAGDAPADPAVGDAIASDTASPAPSEETADALSEPVAAPTANTSAEVASEPTAPADAAAPSANPAAPVASLIPTPYGSEFAREAPDVSPALPGTEAAPAASPAPRPAEAAPDVPTTAGLDAAPAPQPSASAAPAAPMAPASPPETSGAVASATASARPEANAPGLVQPLPQRGAEPALPAPSTEAPSTEAPSAEAPLTDGPATGRSAAGSAAREPEPEPSINPAPGADPTAPPASEALPAIEPTPPGPAPEPGFRHAPGIKVNQLPKIGDAVLPGPLPGAEPPAELTPEALPALVAHAAVFNAAPDAPLLSIVLIDDRSGPGIAADLLADLPFPVTIALDPAAPGAAEAARAYRAAGQEVAILAALPRGATPSDLEVSWQAFVQALPEAVAVLDAPAARLQNDRRLAEQLVLLAADKGHGLLTWDIGLNPAAQLAANASVPQAQVFRRLDAEQESAPVIGRYLDRAAFEASRSGAVVVTASTRPETLAALLDWAVGQSRSVTLAPLSAVLMRDF
ncbi:divergent polysaccharide deacetylase family protein [Frigidibacter sp.]|uniref:divergent polysaccharide deacetylase family protein n=1 Tax=Frigidibacter sp. TaxID=2586418 RepID=UPI0027324CFA|nr:divergent polysaccharide deacetylase family protein [Frigidibacter sp.]MDP3342683.1 divergent polysaccharide deacetylase family protein [Frigidibacter sp.]